MAWLSIGRPWDSTGKDIGCPCRSPSAASSVLGWKSDPRLQQCTWGGPPGGDDVVPVPRRCGTARTLRAGIHGGTQEEAGSGPAVRGVLAPRLRCELRRWGGSVTAKRPRQFYRVSHVCRGRVLAEPTKPLAHRPCRLRRLPPLDEPYLAYGGPARRSHIPASVLSRCW